MHEQEEDLPIRVFLVHEPPLKIDFASVAAAGRPMIRRHTTLLAVGTAVLATFVIIANTVFFSDHSAVPPASAPGTSSTASTTDVTGKWTLTAIDLAGRAIATKAQLGKSGFTVQIQFDPTGTFILNNGACGTTTGTYSVSSNNLSLKDAVTTAGRCGYTSNKIENLADKLATEINKILQADTVTVTVNADQLIITAGADQYSYQRVGRGRCPQPTRWVACQKGPKLQP